jgi:hypothetical protein
MGLNPHAKLAPDFPEVSSLVSVCAFASFQ